jgi:AraC family transcriptional regulator, exoenzyme S synthesis regulatory protein ExsA
MPIYWNSPQETLLPCVQDKYFKQELISGDHSFGRIISGEVKVIIADQIYILNAGDTFFCLRNQLATFIKYPKDGRAYKSVSFKSASAASRCGSAMSW